jgi:hypothetical protein
VTRDGIDIGRRSSTTNTIGISDLTLAVKRLEPDDGLAHVDGKAHDRISAANTSQKPEVIR